jgi:hypothetical protein
MPGTRRRSRRRRALAGSRTLSAPAIPLRPGQQDGQGARALLRMKMGCAASRRRAWDHGVGRRRQRTVGLLQVRPRGPAPSQQDHGHTGVRGLIAGLLRRSVRSLQPTARQPWSTGPLGDGVRRWRSSSVDATLPD